MHPASSCKLSINLVCIIYALHEDDDGLLDSCCSFYGGFLVVAAATAIEVQKKRRKRKMLTKPWIRQRLCVTVVQTME